MASRWRDICAHVTGESLDVARHAAGLRQEPIGLPCPCCLIDHRSAECPAAANWLGAEPGERSFETCVLQLKRALTLAAWFLGCGMVHIDVDYRPDDADRPAEICRGRSVAPRARRAVSLPAPMNFAFLSYLSYYRRVHVVQAVLFFQPSCFILDRWPELFRRSVGPDPPSRRPRRSRPRRCRPPRSGARPHPA